MKIWEMVKAIEEKKHSEIGELEEAKMTFIVNFGENGKCHAGLINEKDTLTQMIVSTFEFYENKLKKDNQPLNPDGKKPQ